MKRPISIQMYSIRPLLFADFYKTLTEISNIGYKGVEFAQYHGIDAKTMKKELDLRNLKTVGSHVAIDLLMENLEKEIEYLKILDCNQLVCPFSKLNDVESAKKFAEIFNKIGEKCHKENVEFSYHNHNMELTMDNGICPLDVFYESTDFKYVKAELDVYWLAKANANPYEFVKKYKDRINLIHLKQIKDGQNVDAPDGEIDFREIVSIVPNALPIYEQENLTEENGIYHIKRSYDYLVNIL